jgi:hypothetical protein
VSIGFQIRRTLVTDDQSHLPANQFSRQNEAGCWPEEGAMQRREFITLLGGAAAAWPLAAGAQPAARIWRVGLLIVTSMRGQSAPLFQSFKEEMRALGYLEGQNLVFITREAEGNLDRLPPMAQELITERADIIVAFTTPAVAAAQRATSTTPIVVLRPGFETLRWAYSGGQF